MPDFSANAGGSFSPATGLMSHSLVMLLRAIIPQTLESVHECAAKLHGESCLTTPANFLELHRRTPVSRAAILAARQRTIFAGNQPGKSAGFFHVARHAKHGQPRLFWPEHSGVEHVEFAGKSAAIVLADQIPQLDLIRDVPPGITGAEMRQHRRLLPVSPAANPPAGQCNQMLNHCRAEYFQEKIFVRLGFLPELARGFLALFSRADGDDDRAVRRRCGE